MSARRRRGGGGFLIAITNTHSAECDLRGPVIVGSGVVIMQRFASRPVAETQRVYQPAGTRKP
jgi:hypothetical protein